jgi:CubicO group peptidase (beta-lactamase class C family)
MKKIILLSLLLSGSLVLKSQTTDISNRIDSIIKLNISKESPGCAVGVVRDGEILYKQTYGLANLDYGIPVTDSTLFNLASVSKQFTAFLVLLLEKEGKLNLDDTMQKYIPELKNYGHPVTIRQLVHHTSGIPSTDNLRLFSGLSLEMPWSTEDEFNMIQSYQKLNFKPNEEHIYSNAGYFLLTRIIEKVTGMTFSDCMSEKIFKSLNMKTATIYDSQGKIIHNRASGYRKSGDSFLKTNTEGESIYGSTNLYASITDMINWSVNLTTHVFGGKEIFGKLLTRSDTLNNGDTINYTYGFFAFKYAGLKILDHGGFTMGFKSHIMYLPDAGFSVFVLSNNESMDPRTIANKIVDWYLKDLLKPEIKKDHLEIAINKELYKKLKGSYLMPDGMVLKFDNENDTLKLIIPGAPKFIMHPETETEFFLKDFDAQCTFVNDSEGKVNEIVWHQNSQNPKGVRFSEPKPLTITELQAYCGKYEIPELNITYNASLRDGELNLTLPKTFRMVNIETEMKLKHVSGNKFYGSLGIIEFRKKKNGKIGGFIIADVGRLRNIEFIRKD